MKMLKNLLFLILFLKNDNVYAHFDMVVPIHKNVFDLNLYESVLDPKLCKEQIDFIRENDQELLIEFLDAGGRTPRGVLTGNLMDFGNYYQCLGIKKPIQVETNSIIEGKYCTINLPLNQTWPSLPTIPEWPDIPWPDIPWPDIPWPPLPELNRTTLRLKDNVVKRLIEYKRQMKGIETAFGVKSDADRTTDGTLSTLTFKIAVCIPKSCSPRTALSSFLNRSDISSIEFEEDYCRLPNDKPWVAGDIVALAIFSFIGLLVILSTAYDLRRNVFIDKDSKKPTQINKLYLAFSVYTNTRRLFSYTPVPGSLECLDGIRTFAMMWVIVGHTFVTQISSEIMANPLDTFNWMTSLKSVWITSAPITVDTFFMLSGLLLVYTSAGKLTSIKLLKNLHLFYLNRLLRMFPVLAAMILLQVSILNWILDGPYWAVAAEQTHRCRVFWWSTLLHIQNYLNPASMCLPHSWYLAIDVQLHILSPIVLVWVLTGKKTVAWASLVISFLLVLAGATIFNFIMDFPAGPVIPSRPNDTPDYLLNYYVNTLTRASPFLVGLIFGYILHLNRGMKLVISLFSSTLLWVCAIIISLLTVYSSYPIMQLDWDNQLADNMINSLMRPGWAMAVGWLIVACEHGYGGLINWILCLRAWKVLGRLSYAMYIVHYPLMFVINATPLAPRFFSEQSSLFRFLSDFSMAVIVAFIMTIFIDSPCSIIIKQVMGGGPKRPPRAKLAETATEKIEECNKELSQKTVKQELTPKISNPSLKLPASKESKPVYLFSRKMPPAKQTLFTGISTADAINLPTSSTEEINRDISSL